MLRRFLIVSLVAHAALLVVWRAPAPAALQAGQRLLIDLIAPSKQPFSTVVDGAASVPADHSNSQRPLINAHTANRVSAGEIAHARNQQVHQYVKARNENENINVTTTALTAADTSDSRHARQAGAADPHPVMNDRTTDNLSASAVGAFHSQQDNSTDLSVSNRVKARLLQALRNHFSYPKIARRYGWEGLVEMHLRVEADGRLSHIELVRSSGYAALDQAALSSTRRIDTVVEAAGWLHGSYIDLSLPVEYRLIDG